MSFDPIAAGNDIRDNTVIATAATGLPAISFADEIAFSQPGDVITIPKEAAFRVLPKMRRPLRIAVTTGYGHWGGVLPSDVFGPSEQMVGGGETAMFQLCRGLAEAGHHVDLFYDSRRFGVDAGISIMPKGMKLSMLSCTDYDVLISWEDLESIEVFHRARKVVLAVQCNTLDMAARDVGVDIYQTVSNWHADELVRSDPSLQAREASYRKRLLVFPNGIDLARYANPPEREPFRIIHSSSPDRGLHHLLALWPRIKRQVPEAALHIYYDMKGWFDAIEHAAGYGVTDIITAPRAHDLQRLLKETEDQGVTTHGGIGQWELAQEQMKSSLMVYPCDPVRPTEGFSISILEGLAAGTPVITSNADALPELWADYTTQVPLPFEESHDELLAAIVNGLTTPRDEEQIAARQRFARTFDWRTLQARYADFIERLVAE